MPALLLQKPHSRSKTKEHVKHLERRLQLWKDGNLNSLLDEGSAIQSQFDRECRGKIKPTDQISRTFSKLMMEGKVRSALRLISEGNNGQLLRLDNLVENGNTNNPPETVLEALLKKHPPKQPAKESTIVTPNIQLTEPHPIIFDKIDGQLIRSTALKMDGAAGPLGLDTAAWKRLCTSFKTASAELCNMLASVARRLCTCLVDPHGLSAFVAGRLIALNKCACYKPEPRIFRRKGIFPLRAEPPEHFPESMLPKKRA